MGQPPGFKRWIPELAPIPTSPSRPKRRNEGPCILPFRRQAKISDSCSGPRKRDRIPKDGTSRVSIGGVTGRLEAEEEVENFPGRSPGLKLFLRADETVDPDCPGSPSEWRRFVSGRLWPRAAAASRIRPLDARVARRRHLPSHALVTRRCERCDAEFDCCGSCEPGRLYCGDECSKASREESATVARARYNDRSSPEGLAWHALEERDRRARRAKERVGMSAAPRKQASYRYRRRRRSRPPRRPVMHRPSAPSALKSSSGSWWSRSTCCPRQRSVWAPWRAAPSAAAVGASSASSASSSGAVGSVAVGHTPLQSPRSPMALRSAPASEIVSEQGRGDSFPQPPLESEQLLVPLWEHAFARTGRALRGERP